MKYIALLRAINVGGNTKIAMHDLKRMFKDLGYENAKTYIHSGNVLFESKDKPEKLRPIIETKIKETFGFDVVTVIVTILELEKIIKECPFEENLDENWRVYITFLAEEPESELVDTFLSMASDDEQYAIEGKTVYALINKNAKTKLHFSANLVEKVLKVKGTSRNWNTVIRLWAMRR